MSTIYVISDIVYFHEIILEISWNVKETTPGFPEENKEINLSNFNLK